MPQSPGNPPNLESSRRVRHLYVVEVVLAAVVLGMIVALVYYNKPPADDGPKTAASGGKKIVTLTLANWQKEVLESPVPVIVDFWAPWCGPCRMLAPVIDDVAERFDGKVKVGKLNVDDAQEIAAQYRIRSIPQVFLFTQGEGQPIEVDAGNHKASMVNIVDAISSVSQ